MALRTHHFFLLLVLAHFSPLPVDCQQNMKTSATLQHGSGDGSSIQAVHLNLVEQMAARLAALEQKVDRLQREWCW